MSEVHRYKAIKLKTAAGNVITYSPHGPDFVPAEAYDQLRAQVEALRYALNHILAMQTRGFITLGDNATSMATAALQGKPAA